MIHHGSISFRNVFGLFLFAWILPSFAQEVGGLRVTVMDQDWNVPVNEAQVILLEKDQRRPTNAEGQVLFEELAPGRYNLMVRATGFERKEVASILVTAGQVQHVECKIQAAYTDMEEYVIKDIDLVIGGGELTQLNIRAQNSSLMDNVGSDMIAKAGASTAAAAMRMVTGASVQDGKYAVIRGLGDRYTTTLLNGVRLPTSDKDKRAVQLDQYPSAMIESIQVTKTFTPEQQGDASGGGINIVTKSVPDKTVLQASLSMEFDTNATGNDDFKTVRGGGNDVAGVRGLQHYPWLPPGDMNKPRGLADQRSSDIQATSPFANYGFKAAAGDVMEPGETWKLGGLLNGSYSQKYKFREGEKNKLQRQKQGPDVALESSSKERVKASADEQLWSSGLTLGAKSEANEVKLTGVYTHLAREIVDERYEGYEPPTVKTNPKTKAVTTQRTRDFKTLSQYSENSNGSLQLAGKHRFESLNDFELDWTGAYNLSESTEPDRQIFQGSYESKKVVDKFGGVLQDESSIKGELERRWHDIREDSVQFQLNGRQPFNLLDYEGYVKSGLFADQLERTYRNRIYQFSPTIPASDEYDFSQFDSVLRQIPFDKGIPTQGSTDYDGQQAIFSYYGMARLPFPEWLDVIGGVRAEGTAMETKVWSAAPNMNGNVFVTRVLQGVNGINSIRKGELISQSDAGASIDQTDLLPAVAINIKKITDVNIRLAYSETIARPTFKELTPVEYSDIDPQLLFVGNQALELSMLRNYDVRVEWRPGNGMDLVAGSLFYKTIADPIQYTSYSDPAAGSDKTYIFPENYEKGWVGGGELELRKSLDIIWEPLKDLSMGGNLTLQDSYVTYTESMKKSLDNALASAKGRKMDGQPEYLVNINLVYQNEERGITTGVFYNFRGETYVSGEAAADGFYTPHVVEKPLGSLDYTLGLKFMDHWKIAFEVKNILDPLVESVYRRSDGTDLPNSSYRYGRTYGISLGYDW